MDPEVWWAIVAVIAAFVFVRFGLPALGLRNRDSRDRAPIVEEPAKPMSHEEDDAPWSKTQRFTEKTVQLPRDEK
jgi:hypothetical protein